MGATTVYNNFILPHMKEYEGRIKEVEKRVQENFNQAKGMFQNTMSSKKD